MKDIKPLKSSLVEAVMAESSKTHCFRLMKIYAKASQLETETDESQETELMKEITMLALAMISDADDLPVNTDGVFKAINDLVE